MDSVRSFPFTILEKIAKLNFALTANFPATMANKSTIHSAHAIIAFILTVAGLAAYYKIDLYGPQLSGADLAGVIGLTTLIMLVLYAVHLHFDL
jgi:hypothetical protein